MAARRRESPLGTIAYDVDGEGPAVVLLHPIGVDRTWWAPYVSHLSVRHRVIAIDLPGHGESAKLRRPVSLAEHAACVLDIVESEGDGPAVVLGVSMGGMVAQGVAIANPHRVRGLVLCATAGSFPQAARAPIRTRGDTSRDGSMLEVIEPTLARWFSSGSDLAIVERCRKRLASDDWYSWSANWEAISELDNLEALARVNVPALVIAGQDDASIPPPVSRQLAEALHGGLVEVPGATHFGAFETPGRFLPLIDAFLDRLAPTASPGTSIPKHF